MPDRLYFSEPFLSSFEAEVTDIREVSRSQGRQLWQIALDRTAFYPTSGGQPYDTGTLSATAPSGVTLRAPIVSVEEDEAGEIWHATSKPLLAGTAVRGEIDWERRRDHMQQHSGQHLLSAVFLHEIAASTVSFHLGEKASTIDLSVEGVSPEELARVEDAANEIIEDDRAVTTRTIPRQDAEDLLTSGSLRKLPEREGPIRLVEIADLDLNACGGTHVRSTGQIGGLSIRKTERVKQGLRIEFLCGLRAIRTARMDLAMLTRCASALSCGPDQMPGAIERLLTENRVSHKERQKLREELAGYHATRLAVEVPIEDGLRIVCRSYSDCDAAYIKLLALRLTSSAPQTCALLASTAEEPAKVVLAVSRDLELDCGAALRNVLAAFSSRGGGTPAMAQGQIPCAQLEAFFAALEASLRKV